MTAEPKVSSPETKQKGTTSGESPSRSDGSPDAKERWMRRLPLLPALIFVALLTQIPFLMTVYFSFRKYDFYRPETSGWAGFDNYQFLLADATFRAAIVNTIIMTVVSVLGALLIGLGFAVLLNRTFRGRGVVRTLLITPFLIMPVASALLWKFMMFDASAGLVNFVLSPIFGDIAWLSEYPMASVITAIVWRWTPFMMLILLAGLQSQDEETIEASKVDGASAFERFRFLTVPHLRPYIELSVLLATIFILQVFDFVYMMTSGGPGTQTTNLPYFIYLEAFRSLDVGKAAALGVVVLIGTLAVAMTALRVLTRTFVEGTNR